ncbi:MAG: DNA methyltransferase [Pseudomonadota bacterium]
MPTFPVVHDQAPAGSAGTYPPKGFTVTFADKVKLVAINELRPDPRNARTHSKLQLRQIASSIERFGFTNPVLIDAEGMILAGHGRVEAAKLIGMDAVPVLRLSHLSEAERRAYVLADNKLALNAGWDRDLLAGELQGLIDLGFEIELTGFSTAEIDFALDASANARPGGSENLDHVPAVTGPAVTRPGDLWALGRHRLLCGNARRSADLALLMKGATARLIFTDPPYNVPIDGHVGGLGKVRHREFQEAAGEMSSDSFTAFLQETLGSAAAQCVDGAIAFVCMDWRHMSELLSAGKAVFSELKNLVVWNKTNAGMGTFYRSKHELIFVFKKGKAPHVNTFGLGDTGRYRTNVWDHAGMTSVGQARTEALAMHPTVKPAALVADALKDCSHRGDIVLDPFGGSGSTLIAAETSGRKARLVEIDPYYCDTTILRWQSLTGQTAKLAERLSSASDQDGQSRMGQSFDALMDQTSYPEEAGQ